MECLADELGSIIVNDSSGYTKAVEHVILDELDHDWCLYFLYRNNFCPFREVICYGQDEVISFRCLRDDRSDKIHSPHLNGHKEVVG